MKPSKILITQILFFAIFNYANAQVFFDTFNKYKSEMIKRTKVKSTKEYAISVSGDSTLTTYTEFNQQGKTIYFINYMYNDTGIFHYQNDTIIYSYLHNNFRSDSCFYFYARYSKVSLAKTFSNKNCSLFYDRKGKIVLIIDANVKRMLSYNAKGDLIKEKIISKHSLSEIEVQYFSSDSLWTEKLQENVQGIIEIKYYLVGNGNPLLIIRHNKENNQQIVHQKKCIYKNGLIVEEVIVDYNNEIYKRYYEYDLY